MMIRSRVGVSSEVATSDPTTNAASGSATPSVMMTFTSKLMAVMLPAVRGPAVRRT